MDRETEGEAMNMNLSELLDEAAVKRPHGEAVVCGDSSYDYRQLRDRTLRLANALKGMGVVEGDRIAILHRNCHRFIESYFAAAYIGAIMVPMNFRLSPREYRFILCDSDAKLLITHPEFSAGISDMIGSIPSIECFIWTERPPGLQEGEDHFIYEELLDSQRTDGPECPGTSKDRIAQIYYTSGTTGKPKGVVLTHGNNLTHARWSIEELALCKDDRWLHVSPMFHLADSWAVWAMTQVCGVHVIASEFKAEDVLASIAQNGVTMSNFIPTMLNILVNSSDARNHRYDSLRLVMSGGAPIAPDVVSKVLDIFGCDYIQTYGMTETSPFLTMSILEPHLKSLPFERRFQYMVTTGRVFGGVELKVVDKHLKDVARDGEQVGEIIVKGETITSQYWKLPEETHRRIRDGWLHTGDMATINEEGYVTIVDRKDDMIITGGEIVYSIEVENVLYSHPEILEAAVVGIPDPIWGERIVAAVVMKPHGRAKEGEIMGFLRQRLAHFKVPKNIIFFGELPKTGSSKISKHMVKDKLKDIGQYEAKR